jgi:outer membrane biosynthesis protein TonB
MAIDYQEPHRREGLIGTLVVHGVLLLLFMFMVFKGPNPPLAAIGGDGVELNYGLDEAGSGDVQSMATANNSPNREDSRPPVANPEPQPRPVAAATPDPTPPSQEKIITSEAEESGVSETPVETPAPPKEEVKPAPKPARKVAVTFSPKGNETGGGNGVNGSSNAPTGNNNGDRPGAVGDQGDPEGSLDAKALYGAPGRGGSGSSPGSGGLEMSGWAPDSTPNVKAVDDNSGVIRFRIRINEEGEIQSIAKVSGNVSAAQEKLCRDALNDMSFRRTNSGSGGATGFYTFKITVR